MSKKKKGKLSKQNKEIRNDFFNASNYSLEIMEHMRQLGLYWVSPSIGDTFQKQKPNRTYLRKVFYC